MATVTKSAKPTPVFATRTVEVSGITLPFTIPAVASIYPGYKHTRDERSGEVFISLEELYRIVEETTDDGIELYGAYVNLDNETGYALEGAGFVERTTGHSWSGTTELYEWGRTNKVW